MIFEDRSRAGEQLARRLAAYAGTDTRVLALPRGGVPVAYEVASALGAPLDVFIVRKLGAPGREELALGAIASGGVRVINQETVDALGIENSEIEAIATRELAELQRRELAYRNGRPAHDVAGRNVILIDDGLATGASMQAAVLALRMLAPKSIVGAVPVAPVETCALLAAYADEMLCLTTPQVFRGVGAWYADFRQVSDEEVRDILAAAAKLEGRAQ